jgi:Cof subfamily protein (haloacid dehalogenase superfamily)
MEVNMYKLIGIDMDGTLLKDDKTISAKNVETIKKAIKQGIKIVISTGRHLKGIEKYLNQLDLISNSVYAVCLNGSIVQNTKTHDSIYEKLLKIEDAKYIYNLGEKINVNVQIALKESNITPILNEYSIEDSRLTGVKFNVQDIDTIDSSEHIFKVMFMQDPEILSKSIKKLPNSIYKKYTALKSEPCFLEFINKDSNKWNGIKAVANHFGIKKDEILCIGDSGNDVAMIKHAGLGVAMGNAIPEIKKIASYITKTNEEDGVAHVIEKFVLNK